MDAPGFFQEKLHDLNAQDRRGVWGRSADRYRAPRARTRAKRRAASSTSARVVSSPREARTAELARASPSMAISTGEGSAVPALQAEPLETATPSRSSAAQSSSP